MQESLQPSTALKGRLEEINALRTEKELTEAELNKLAEEYPEEMDELASHLDEKDVLGVETPELQSALAQLDVYLADFVTDAAEKLAHDQKEARMGVRIDEWKESMPELTGNPTLFRGVMQGIVDGDIDVRSWYETHDFEDAKFAGELLGYGSFDAYQTAIKEDPEMWKKVLGGTADGSHSYLFGAIKKHYNYVLKSYEAKPKATDVELEAGNDEGFAKALKNSRTLWENSGKSSNKDFVFYMKFQTGAQKEAYDQLANLSPETDQNQLRGDLTGFYDEWVELGKPMPNETASDDYDLGTSPESVDDEFVGPRLEDAGAPEVVGQPVPDQPGVEPTPPLPPTAPTTPDAVIAPAVAAAPAVPEAPVAPADDVVAAAPASTVTPEVLEKAVKEAPQVAAVGTEYVSGEVKAKEFAPEDITRRTTKEFANELQEIWEKTYGQKKGFKKMFRKFKKAYPAAENFALHTLEMKGGDLTLMVAAKLKAEEPVHYFQYSVPALNGEQKAYEELFGEMSRVGDMIPSDQLPGKTGVAPVINSKNVAENGGDDNDNDGIADIS